MHDAVLPPAPAVRPRAPGGASLYDVVLAGSHDSAAYATAPALASRAALAPLRLSRAARWATGAVLRDYAATQALDVRGQLRAGVRFLDLRVTRLAPGFEKADGRFWCCHGQALCVPLEEVLAGVNAFHHEAAAWPALPGGEVDLPVVTVWRTFSLAEEERAELGEYVRLALVGGCFGGAPEDLRATPLAELPRNVVAGLPAVNARLPAAWGTDAWLDTFSAPRKLRFLAGVVRGAKDRGARDDLCVVGFTVTAHTLDVVVRIVSGGVLRPSLKTEALKMNKVLPSFLCSHEDALARKANVIFADFVTPDIIARIDQLNALVDELQLQPSNASTADS